MVAEMGSEGWPAAKDVVEPMHLDLAISVFVMNLCM